METSKSPSSRNYATGQYLIDASSVSECRRCTSRECDYT